MTTRTCAMACAATAVAAWIAQDTSGPPRDVDITVTEGTSMAAAALRRMTTRPGASPCWAPSDMAIAFVSRTDRREESGIWMIDDQGRERLVAGQPENGSVGSPSWNPDGDIVAFIRSDELGVRLIAGQIVTRFEDVFPFKPQWLSRSEVLYTADGHIKRRSVRTPAQIGPFRAKVSLSRPS